MLVYRIYYIYYRNGFCITDFNKFVVKKTLGTNSTGYIVGCFFLSAGIGSYVTGILCNTRIGRKGMAIFSGVSEIICYIIMLFYKVDENNVTTFDKVFTFVYPCVLNFVHMFWNSQLPAIIQLFYEGKEFKQGIARI